MIHDLYLILKIAAFCKSFILWISMEFVNAGESH